jgi:hypothetical protein
MLVLIATFNVYFFKPLFMVTAENIKTQLKALLVHRRGVDFNMLYLYSPAFNYVHDFFAEDEVMSGYCTGPLTRSGKQVRGGKWLAICTNLQLILLHKGLLTGLTHFEIPLADITGVTIKLRWWSNIIKIRDKTVEWEMFQLNKTDMQFFELALNDSIAALKK